MEADRVLEDKFCGEGLLPSSGLLGATQGRARREVNNGESYPVGLWPGSWSAATLVTKLAKILIEERGRSEFNAR